jgi:hypothetical protein
MASSRKIKYDNSSLLGKNLDSLDQLIPGTNYMLGKNDNVRQEHDGDATAWLATSDNIDNWVIDNKQKKIHPVKYIGRNDNNKYKFIKLKINEDEDENEDEVEEYSDEELMSDDNSNTNIWEINQRLPPDISKNIAGYFGGKLRKRKTKSIRKKIYKKCRKSIKKKIYKKCRKSIKKKKLFSLLVF